MKRFLLVCAVIFTIYACQKQAADPVYDTHLFALLAGHDWVFDSARVTDSVSFDTTLHAAMDSTYQLTSFSSQYYTINNVKDTMVFDTANMLRDSTLALDTAVYQITYDNPDKIYYYYVGGQVVTNRYLLIDTVNENLLVLNKLDTPKTVSHIYYHAR